MADTSTSPVPGPGPGSVVLLTSPVRNRLVLSGELDLNDKAKLRDAVADAVERRLPVDVDTRNVTFMDSTAIAALSHLVQRLPHRLRFIQPPDLVRLLLEITGISDAVAIVEHDPGFPGLTRAAASPHPVASAQLA